VLYGPIIYYIVYRKIFHVKTLAAARSNKQFKVIIKVNINLSNKFNEFSTEFLNFTLNKNKI